MKKLKPTYHFVSILLLTLILSHISLFHFELMQKVLCVGEGNHIHVERIIDSHINNNLLIDNDTKNKFVYDNCTDYRLDHHIDEDFVKTNKLNFNSIKVVIKINLDAFTKYNFSHNINQTNTLINNIPLDSYSTISLLI